ncbi:heat shock factor protein 5 [Pempheris klunzingeri]|uniref:heat shock factor protein 5 n=1 Tax=Pempheris klunzingeri TaxID=3127111 RepID=UPI003980CB7D
MDDSSLPDSINPNNFPAKLWRLVNNPAYKAISWDGLGEAIVINQPLFERQVLSPSASPSDNMDAFKTTNFSSFVRQLNLYGFRKPDSAIRDSHHSTGDSGTYHHFYNPNFKQNHPELVVSLKRLTVDNKAKLQAGLDVTCRPPSRYQRFIGGNDGMFKGSSKLLSPTHQESTHPYYPNKAQAMMAHNGTPVPPRYLMRGHGAALSPTVFASDKGMPVSLSHHYAGHSHNKENKELKKCDINLDTIFQIADEVMETAPNSCLLRVVTPEKPGSALVPPPTSCNTVLCDTPASTVNANPLYAGPIIMAVSGNVDLAPCGQKEESVVSVPEQMPEDAISEVTSDGAEVIAVEVGDTSQAYSSSGSTGSAPDV